MNIIWIDLLPAFIELLRPMSDIWRVPRFSSLFEWGRNGHALKSFFERAWQKEQPIAETNSNQRLKPREVLFDECGKSPQLYFLGFRACTLHVFMILVCMGVATVPKILPGHLYIRNTRLYLYRVIYSRLTRLQHNNTNCNALVTGKIRR